MVAGETSELGECSGTPIRFGIAAKLGVCICTCVLVAAAAVGYSMHRPFSESLVGDELEDLARNAEIGGVALSRQFETLRQDLLFLAHSEPAEGVVRTQEAGGRDPIDGSPASVPREQLTALFVRLLQDRPEYLRLRYIRTADGGRAYAGADRRAAGVRAAQPEELKQLDNEHLLREAVGLERGAVYLSEINAPPQPGRGDAEAPKLRAATLVRTALGSRLGMVVAEVDLRRLFAELRSGIQGGESLYVANHHGEILFRGGDAAPAVEAANGRMYDLFPEVEWVFRNPGGGPYGVVHLGSGGGSQIAVHTVAYDPLNPERFVAVCVSKPANAIVAAATASRDRSLLLGLVLVLGAIVISIGVARSLTRPLRQVARAATAFGLRGELGDLPVRAGDEVGVMARSFAEMIRQVNQRTEALQFEVDQRRQAEQALARHAVDLARHAQRLARSNEELEQFAYVASHDLQEPLRLIASYVQLLQRRYADKLDADADEFIAYAVDGARRMQKLIQDLLAYSRVGTRGVCVELTDCTVVLAQTLRDLAGIIDETGAQVTHGPLPTVRADPAQLGQVFQNLVGNALKFRGDEPPRVHVGAEQVEDEWVFSIEDNGIGIDPVYQERIFVIFQRLHHREAYDGTGLGLAICKKVVERHGGRIWFESQPGEGATFHFTLPAGGGVAGEGRTESAPAAELRAVKNAPR